MPKKDKNPYIFIFCLMFCITLFTGQACLAEESGVDLDTIKVLDLKTAQKIALAGNPSLAAAEERVHQARERVQQAASAYWPRLDATGSASRTFLSDNDYQTNLAAARRTNPFATVDDELEYYRTALTASWILFNGFERKFSNMSARYGEQGSHEARMNAQRMLLSSVAASYYNAQLARENITIAEAGKAFNQRQHEDAKARYRVGTGSLSDELNFEIQINSAKADLIKAEQAYETAVSGLSALMGISGTAFLSKIELARLQEETFKELVPPEISPHMIEYAMKHRPDILQLDYLVRQADSNIG
ncbi:MAG: TolC family protein, partial [Deltaproteobacteria bacterium]|nr:TolC family protein [Deltaproteobacteria bacterium]